jgi:hypothetical protein
MHRQYAARIAPPAAAMEAWHGSDMAANDVGNYQRRHDNDAADDAFQVLARVAFDDG